MLNFIPAKILSYDADQRTAQVQIDGLTDGSESTVLQHSWQHVRAIVVSGTPSYFVSSSKV